jgi:hypothetical protein
MQTLVIIQKGKSDYKADLTAVEMFDTIQLAQQFCKNNESVGKYWTKCTIVEPGEFIDTKLED